MTKSIKTTLGTPIAGRPSRGSTPAYEASAKKDLLAIDRAMMRHCYRSYHNPVEKTVDKKSENDFKSLKKEGILITLKKKRKWRYNGRSIR